MNCGRWAKFKCQDDKFPLFCPSWSLKAFNFHLSQQRAEGKRRKFRRRCAKLKIRQLYAVFCSHLPLLPQFHLLYCFNYMKKSQVTRRRPVDQKLRTTLKTTKTFFSVNSLHFFAWLSWVLIVVFHLFPPPTPIHWLENFIFISPFPLCTSVSSFFTIPQCNFSYLKFSS